MKTLMINGLYYKYPVGISTIEDFMCFLQANEATFLPMLRYDFVNCAYPYLIAEDINQTFVNFSVIGIIEEMDMKIINRAEYDERLREVIENVCKSCANNVNESEDDNMTSYRKKINLDGECHFKQKI